MKTHLIALSFVAALSPFALGCAGDEPPPMTPADQPPPPPPQPPVGADAPPTGTQYASGDVAVGGDDGNGNASGDAYQDNDPSALQDFHPALDSSGTWQDDPTYGTVWVPSQQVVGADFVPYQTAGHWAYDNDEYVWVSDYDWGWAPYHYGRWVVMDGGGWAWIPGRVYRGAWVGWGADPGYATVGWYPMGPEFIWRGGVAIGYTYSVGPRWAYCGRGDVFAANVGAHVYVGAAAAGFAGRVQPIAATGGAHFAGGPAPSRLGYSAAQVPHATGGAGFAKAQAFSRPSTAVAAGGHMATRTPTPSGSASTTFAGNRTNVGERTTTGTTPGAHGPAGGTTTATTHGGVQPGTTGGSSSSYPTGRTTGGTTTAANPTGQPQPKKKPVPQGDAPAPKKGTGGRTGGTHHK
jgi:hypothetical protein